MENPIQMDDLGVPPGVYTSNQRDISLEASTSLRNSLAKLSMWRMAIWQASPKSHHPLVAGGRVKNHQRMLGEILGSGCFN